MYKTSKPGCSGRMHPGFSFIEVLIATMIVAVLVVGIMSMNTVHIGSNHYVSHHSKAIQLAEERLESLHSVPFDSMAVYLTNITGGDFVEEFGTIPNYPEFQRTTQLLAGNVTRSFSISVQWRGNEGSLSTPIVLYGMRTQF